MTYAETIQYLFASTPVFEHIGAAAYKPGLATTEALDSYFGHPHRQYQTIHVAGTNGKGSVSHTLAAILQSAGYKVGLYTSPHLVDFRERIRVNGQCISEQEVVDFVAQYRHFFEPLHPSFFELTTAMAFRHFAKEQVDIAVIEVGLGGRLDCTNIITPILSVITNISLDHTQLLGSTLAAIAREKGGIIKENVPVVIGQTHPETRPVFETIAADRHAPITFAEDDPAVENLSLVNDGSCVGSEIREDDSRLVAYRLRHQLGADASERRESQVLLVELSGACQTANTDTILHAVRQLQEGGVDLPFAAVEQGFRHVTALTGLRGRWETIATAPLTICDTGHNVDAWRYLSRQLEQLPCRTLHIVFGMVDDKDLDGVLRLLPPNEPNVGESQAQRVPSPVRRIPSPPQRQSAVRYYFTQPATHRAVPVSVVAERAAAHGLQGSVYPTVAEAYRAAQHAAATDDAIFIGGSSYVVADLLSSIP